MQKVDALLPSIIELDSYAECGDEKTYDGKIQEIAKIIGEARPDLRAEIEEVYSSRKFNSFQNRWGKEELDERSKAQFQQIQEKILNALDKAMPDLHIQQRMQKQHALREALHAALQDGIMSKLERLFKEENELDLDTPVESPENGKIETYLSYIANLSFVEPTELYSSELYSYSSRRVSPVVRAEPVLKFLLMHGAKITDANREDVLKFLEINLKDKIFDEEFFKLLAAQNCDLSDLPFYKFRPELIPTVFLHGANPSKYMMMNDDGSRHWDELAVIRDEIMQKFFPDRTYQSLKNYEREFIFHRGQEIYKFRNEWRKGVASGENREAFAVHEKFVKAIEERNFTAAKGLLKHIDINAPLMSSARYGHAPLLVYAVFKGDIEMIKFLLKAGANVNVFYHEKDARHEWLPPIITAAMQDIPNKEQVLELLKKAKADINMCDLAERTILTYATHFYDLPNVMQVLENYIKYGLDINKTDLWHEFVPREKADEFHRALLFYGGSAAYSRYHPDLAKIRDETLAEMNREMRQKQAEEMLKLDPLKGFSRDVIGEITGFHEKTLLDLTPDERIELHSRCQKKYMASKPAG